MEPRFPDALVSAEVRPTWSAAGRVAFRALLMLMSLTFMGGDAAGRLS